MEALNKVKALSYIVIPPIFAFTGLKKEIVVILAILIFIDLVTAIIRELVMKEGKFNSRTLWIGLSSKELLILIPLIHSLAGKGVGFDLKWIAELSLSMLILAETYSILGNIIQIRNNDKTLDEQDAVTLVIKGIERFLKHIITSLLSRLKEKK